jgi:hypothetical protein
MIRAELFGMVNQTLISGKAEEGESLMGSKGIKQTPANERTVNARMIEKEEKRLEPISPIKFVCNLFLFFEIKQR